MKITFILLNVFATAAVIAHGTAAQGETLSSHAVAAIGYELIGEPERLSVGESIALQPTLFDIFKNSDYYYGSLYRSKLPHGIDPWADYHQGHHGKSCSHGLFGNHSGCNPLAAILELPFSLFGGCHSKFGGCQSTGCGANCDGRSDCDANHCYSSAPSTTQPPQEQPNSSTLNAQQQTPVFQHPQTVEPPRPMDPGVVQDVEQQPIQPEGDQPNDIDLPENDLPINVIPDDYLPAEPEVLTPTRVEAPHDLNLRIREAAPINEVPTALPPANALPEHSLLNDSAKYLNRSPSNTLGATIRIAAPQQAVPLHSGQARSGLVKTGEARSVPVRNGEARELRTARLVRPTPRAARPEGATVRFRVYQ